MLYFYQAKWPQSESNATIEKTPPTIEYKLISFSPEKISKIEKYSFRDCLDDDDLTALKARFEKALEMPEFSMFMEKMDACVRIRYASHQK